MYAPRARAARHLEDSRAHEPARGAHGAAQGCTRRRHASAHFAEASLRSPHAAPSTAPGVIVLAVDRPLELIEFPADDPDRARRFWSGLLGVELAQRSGAEGRGWQTHLEDPGVGIHERGSGPGDTVSLPYFTVADMNAALEQVKALGGSVIHPGSRWAICRDSEGSPFGLALDSRLS
jgi:predicted enzyme related to lactoylglutathione lyase